MRCSDRAVCCLPSTRNWYEKSRSLEISLNTITGFCRSEKLLDSINSPSSIMSSTMDVALILSQEDHGDILESPIIRCSRLNLNWSANGSFLVLIIGRALVVVPLVWKQVNSGRWA